MEQWPAIHSALGRNATLVVLYGFSPAFLASLKAAPGAAAWLEHMYALLGQPGVEYVGMVGPLALAQHYAQAGFLLYPTSFPETGCVAAMKARRRDGGQGGSWRVCGGGG